MKITALSTPARLAAFLVVLAVVFGGATAVGNAVGPVRSTTAAGEAHAAADTHSAGSTESDDTHAGGDSHDVNDADTAESRTRGELTDDLPDGLAVSQQGYTLRLDQTELTAVSPTTCASWSTVRTASRSPPTHRHTTKSCTSSWSVATSRASSTYTRSVTMRAPGPSR
jgi:hypothetical protein